MITHHIWPVANFFPQPGKSQMYGLSPVWERSWTCEESDRSEHAIEAQNANPGSLGSPMQTLRWWAVVYSFPQPSYSQRKDFSPTFVLRDCLLSWSCNTIWKRRKANWVGIRIKDEATKLELTHHLPACGRHYLVPACCRSLTGFLYSPPVSQGTPD